MLLQHIWTNYSQFFPQLQDYQDLIEKVKLTPRIWNSDVKINDILKYLSWVLDLSINLIGLKYTKNPHSDTFKCTHTRPCFLPYYKYQNPYIRFCKAFRKKFQINILEFKTQPYIIDSASCNPILINQLPNFNFHYKSEPVTLHDIESILKQKPTETKSFSITLYSTSTYVKSCHTKVISENIVGHLPSDSKDTLHLFLMPHLHGSTFDVHVLEELTSKNIGFNQKNVYCNTHITEGKYEFKNPSQTNKEILNQDHCICEHPDTERYHTPNNKAFNPLGKTLKKSTYTYLYIKNPSCY